jgi:thiol-disulfide isomerase/thioredoxin
MEPLLKELSEKYRIMKIDVEENPVETSEYSISSVPTLIFFKNGQVIKKHVGQMPKQSIIKVFEE